MGELMFLIVPVVSGAALMLVLVELAATVVMPNIDRWSKRYFIAHFVILMLYSCFCIIDVITALRTDMRTVQQIVYYFETLLSTILLPMLTMFLLHCCGENWRESPLFRAVTALWVVFFLILNLVPFTTWFYYITPDNQFCRGPFYPLVMALIEAMQVLCLAGVIRGRSKLSQKYYYSFIVGIFPMAVVVFVHFFIDVFLFFSIGISICGFAMFGIILFDQAENLLRQQRELAHQRVSIMALQMRPHFIYNTMTSVYYLIDQDPQKAKTVTMDFTTYLRKNFSAIVSEKPVPFTEELVHTRAYLAVEQAQFEDRLFVDFDTSYTSFYVPPLTLQPIVENAVKHGMDPDSEPLRISVRTRETEAGSEIIVEDNGSGFDPSKDSVQRRALSIIQERLEIMSRGKLDVKSREGGGTVVKVTIPWEHAESVSPLQQSLDSRSGATLRNI